MSAPNRAAGTNSHNFELVVIERDGETSVLPIAEGATTIGSDLSCHVLVNDASVEPQHAELLLTHDGELWLRDLAGRHNTLVNGIATTRAKLEDGSFIKLGLMDLSIRLGGANSGQHGTLIRQSGAGEVPALSPPHRLPADEAVPAVTPLRASTIRRKDDLSRSSGLRPQPPPPSGVRQATGARPPTGVKKPPSAVVPRGAVNLSLDGEGEEEFASEPTSLSGRMALPEKIGPGTIISERYRVLSKIAEGGMGEVYKGVHIELEKPVAIKLMRRELSDDAGFADRFKREAIAASRIGQQNICDVSDFGRTPGGVFFFVMEYLDGQTLGQVIRDRGALPLGRAIPIFTQLCQALASAHHAGIVHRDLKPENVMILQRPGQQDFVKVLDFGVAKIPSKGESHGQTQVGMVVGTPQYMAPEQASALKTDARTDIYALGLIFHEMLQGRPTFKEDTASMLMAAQIYKTAPPLTFVNGDPMPDYVQSFVQHMLAKKPEERPQALEAVLDALQQVQVELLAPVAKLATPAYTPPVRPSDLAALRASSDESRAKQRSAVGAQAAAGRGPVPVATGPEEPTAQLEPEGASRSRDAEAEDLAAIGGGKKSRTGLIAGGLAAVVLLGGGAAFLLGGGKSASNEGYAIQEVKPPPEVRGPPPPVDPPPRAEVKPAADPAPPASPATVKVTLSSTPAGAEITQDGAVIGKTPLELRWEKGKAATFAFVLEGFVREEKKIAPVADYPLELTLKKVAAAGPKPAGPGKSRPPKAELKDDPYGGKVEDIKDDPYN